MAKMFQLTADNVHVPFVVLDVYYVDKVSGGNGAHGKTLGDGVTYERIL